MKLSAKQIKERTEKTKPFLGTFFYPYAVGSYCLKCKISLVKKAKVGYEPDFSRDYCSNCKPNENN